MEKKIINNLTINNLTIKIGSSKKKKYQNNLLFNTEININPGEFNFLMGSNGSGKSTFFYNFSQLKHNLDIHFFIDNLKLNSKERKLLFQKTTYIFQNPKTQLLGLKGLEELKLSKSDFSIEDEDFFELIEFKKELLSLNTWDLSFGQMRKFLLLELLLKQSKIILLDEPTNNLDYQSQINFFLKLKEITKAKKLFAFVISHDPNLISLFADNIFAIEDSKFIKINSKTFDPLHEMWLPILLKIENHLPKTQKELVSLLYDK